MGKLSLFIGDLYHKYQPEAERIGVKLSLDYPDTTQDLADESVLPQVEKQLSSMLERSQHGEVTLAVRKGIISITDRDTVLSKPLCRLLSNSRVTVKSRIGFGTKVEIRTGAGEKGRDAEGKSKLKAREK